MEENETKVLKVTSIEELKKSLGGELIELPGFIEDIPFVARLKKPSILALTKAKKIPNSLLTEANKLFSGGVGKVANTGVENEETLEDIMQLMEIICEAAFVEPKYKDLKDNGIELTDEQIMAVFSYTQRGVKSLENFRP